MRLFVGFLVIAILAAALLTGLGYVTRNLGKQATPDSPPAEQAEAPPPEAPPGADAEAPPSDAGAELEPREKLISDITSFNAAKLLKCAVGGESGIPSPAGAGYASVRLDYRLINDTPYNLRGVVLTVTLATVGGQTREEHLQDPRWIEADTTLQEYCELKYRPSERGIPLCQIRVKCAYLKPAAAEKLSGEHPGDWQDELTKWEWRPAPGSS